MKPTFAHSILVTLLLAASLPIAAAALPAAAVAAAPSEYTFGKWAVEVTEEGLINIAYSDRQVLKNAYAETTFSLLPDGSASSFKTGTDAPTITLDPVDDCFGPGQSLSISTSTTIGKASSPPSP